MNVTLPPKFQPPKVREKLTAMRMCFIFCGYVLHNTFEFDEDQLAEFCYEIERFFKAESYNKTLAEEAEAWAKKHNFFQEGW